MTTEKTELEQQPVRKCLRKADIEKILNVGRTTRQKITRQPDFPKPFKLGGTLEVWDSDDFYKWLDAQKAEYQKTT